MGLFYRREQPQTELPYTISLGQNHTKLIVGLGNPGEKYDSTRHNVGFACLDALAKAENSSWQQKKTLKCLVSEMRIGQSRIILCKPQTFMNLSGEAVQSVQHFYKITNADTVVVHDELDIKFGQIRTRIGGSAAGHNGIKSLISHTGEDFGRIRVGVANEYSSNLDSADFVLQKFSKDEQEHLKSLSTEVVALLNEFAVGDQLQVDTRSFL
ncbi:MAG: aminoacyl-tRNA hydrolase [bacterium]|nr:aminoacyl-tRNA hydrolase [bacterium]